MTKEEKFKLKVVVAMSGGVDSGVAAALLKKEGYNVVGVFMQFWFPKGEIYGENRCCSLESFNEAKKVADILDIPLHKLNVGKQFKSRVVDEFLRLYGSGKTPNPCVTCNKFIKFDLLLKHAKTIWGADYLATGHYVRLGRTESRIKNQELRQNLLRGKDKNKDQSYFLYNLGKKDLPHLLFPVGGYTKPEIRNIAKKLKLPVYSRSDSQEICFVGNSHYDFLKKYLKLKAGNIIDEKNVVLGHHSGLPLYTIGQRTGLGLAGGPWYVCGFNRQKNELVVTHNQTKSNIFGSELKCNKINWIGGQPKLPLKCQAQIRYRTKPVDCMVSKSISGLKVVFNSKQRAIMAGQSIVFYNGQEVLGGGVII